jgi:hypothetical protein
MKVYTIPSRRFQQGLLSLVGDRLKRVQLILHHAEPIGEVIEGGSKHSPNFNVRAKRFTAGLADAIPTVVIDGFRRGVFVGVNDPLDGFL